MKIAIAGILNKPIIDNSLGGTEQFTFDLVEGLINLNHDLSLFATSDSKTRAKLISVCDSKDTNGVVEGGTETRIPYHLLQSSKIAIESGGFDIVHNSYFESFFLTPFSPWYKCPIVTTVHNDFWQFSNIKKVLEKTQREEDVLVFVSKKARDLAGNPKNSQVIYNGINTSKYKFKAKNEKDNLFWLSRIGWKKGAKESIQVALETGKELILNGNYYFPASEKYFEENVRPFLSPNIRHFSVLSPDEKISHYQNAKAFLFPIQWEEPFGLVMIEAMACGTPVVAFSRGSVPEILRDGLTGFIVNPSDDDIRGDFIIKKTGIEGLCEAIERIYAMPEEEYLQMRQNCRKHIEDNFTIEKMVKGYEEVYKKVFEASR
jgi:glycosyltransferase involved in cell wall biosynthesis